MPHPVPDIMDTGAVYTDEPPFASTFDITVGMKYGLLKLTDIVPADKMYGGMRSFCNYVDDRQRNVFSHRDGGQLMFNFVIDGKALLWSAHSKQFSDTIFTPSRRRIPMFSLYNNNKDFKGSRF